MPWRQTAMILAGEAQHWDIVYARQAGPNHWQLGTDNDRVALNPCLGSGMPVGGLW